MDLNDKGLCELTTTELAESHRKQVSGGLIRRLELENTQLKDGDGDNLPAMEILSRGILSPSCAVMHLRLDSVVGFEHIPLRDLITPQLLKHLGPILKSLEISGTGVSGDVPEALYEHCIHLQILHICWEENLEAKLSPKIGRLKKLRKLGLWGEPSGFFGQFPIELAQCKKLRRLNFDSTQLEIPDTYREWRAKKMDETFKDGGGGDKKKQMETLKAFGVPESEFDDYIHADKDIVQNELDRWYNQKFETYHSAQCFLNSLSLPNPYPQDT